MTPATTILSLELAVVPDKVTVSDAVFEEQSINTYPWKAKSPGNSWHVSSPTLRRVVVSSSEKYGKKKS